MKMKTDNYLTPASVAGLDYHTPPACQGQAVTYSYATLDTGTSACILRRRSEGGEPPVFELYEDPEWDVEYSDNLDFWDSEPELGDLVESLDMADDEVEADQG